MSAPPPGQGADAEKNIEIWKVKKLIKRLEAARGNGTSMISLIIRTPCPPVLSALRGLTADTPPQRPRIRSRAPRRCWLKNLYAARTLPRSLKSRLLTRAGYC